LKTNVYILSIICSIFIVSSCRSIRETKALQDCSYSLSNISNLEVNGVSLNGKQNLRDLKTQESSRISQAIMARKIPISLTAHVRVHNPNAQKAALNNLDWKLLLRNQEVADGTITERYEISPNETVEIPINIVTDIGSILKVFSVKELTSMVFSMSSIQTLSKDVQLKIKPSIRVGRMSIKSPAFFSVNIP